MPVPENLLPKVEENTVTQSNYGFPEGPKWFGPPVIKTRNPYGPPDWGSLGLIAPPAPGMVKVHGGGLAKREDTLIDESGHFIFKPEVLKRMKAEADAEEKRLAKLPPLVPTNVPSSLIECGFLYPNVSQDVRNKCHGEMLDNAPGSLSARTYYFLLPLSADPILPQVIEFDDAFQHPMLGPCLVLTAGQDFVYGTDGVGRYVPVLNYRHRVSDVLGTTKFMREEQLKREARKTGVALETRDLRKRVEQLEAVAR